MRIKFDITNKKFDIAGDDLTIIENKDSVIAYMGIPLFSDADALAAAVTNNAFLAPLFSGPYCVFSYDKLSAVLTVSQHMFGAPSSIYYCSIDNCIYMYSSLKAPKAEHSNAYELNKAMLPYFIYNGFLPGDHTLVRGIRKLAPGTKLVISKDGINQIRLSFEEMIFGVETAPACEEDLSKLYDDMLDKTIRNAVDTAGKLNVALSGGFDSNIILYNIKKKCPEEKINTFSVGGVSGVDETTVASEIAGLYDNVSFNKGFVDSNTYKALDEIVDRLEGTMYERGIFLQYELSKLLAENGCSHMICGECADQVFHTNTYKCVPDGNFIFSYPDTPYEMASYVVLKKNQLMMSSFGIKGLYPFLDSSALRLGYFTRHLNGKTKEFHKQQCRRILPPELMEKIGKQGGSTSLAALFDHDVDYVGEISRSPYNMPDFHLKGAFTWDEAIRDYYLTLKYIESFEKQFCDR